MHQNYIQLEKIRKTETETKWMKFQVMRSVVWISNVHLALRSGCVLVDISVVVRANNAASPANVLITPRTTTVNC